MESSPSLVDLAIAWKDARQTLFNLINDGIKEGRAEAITAIAKAESELHQFVSRT